MKETNHKLGIWCMSILLGVVMLLTGRTITGYFMKGTLTETIGIRGLTGLLVLIVLGIFFFMHRKNIKSFLFNLLMTFAIILGLFVVFKFVNDLELISALLSLTFGVWAIIWTLNARSVLSPGSSMKKYATSFFFCLLFVLILSIWDAATSLFKFEGLLVHIKYIIMIFVYTTFVFTSYRIYRMGKEFGFTVESNKIKKVVARNKTIKSKKAKKK